MTGATTMTTRATTTVWTGRVLSAVPVALLLLSATLKLTQPPMIVQMFGDLGYDQSQLPALAVLELACVVIYLIPATAILGAVLLTGYFGGAIATHLRVGQTFNTVTPLALGILVWAGLYLRDAGLRELLPVKSR